MPSLAALQQTLSTLESQLEAFKQEGDYLLGMRLERSPAGGTASEHAKETCKYARLRSGRGKLLPNGKKSMYVPISEIARYAAACQRGEHIHKLEQEIKRVAAQIAKMEHSHYRSVQGGQPKQRRQRYAPTIASRSASAIVEVDPPSTYLSPTAAILVLYRQRADAPVHAVAAEIWQGNQKIADVKAIHCMGMRADKVSTYLKELLLSLSQQFGVWKFEDVVKELPVEQCPIVPCPLKTAEAS